MNKKIGMVMVFVLLVGAVFLSGCQQEAVGKMARNVDIVGEGENLDPTLTSYLCKCKGGSQSFDCGSRCNLCCGGAQNVEWQHYMGL